MTAARPKRCAGGSRSLPAKRTRPSACAGTSASSFDHRIVDGWDAATFVQRIRALLEMPVLLFVDD
jgi:hypothetical protein